MTDRIIRNWISIVEDNVGKIKDDVVKFKPNKKNR